MSFCYISCYHFFAILGFIMIIKRLERVRQRFLPVRGATLASIVCIWYTSISCWVAFGWRSRQFCENQYQQQHFTTSSYSSFEFENLCTQGCDVVLQTSNNCLRCMSRTQLRVGGRPEITLAALVLRPVQGSSFEEQTRGWLDTARSLCTVSICFSRLAI